MLPYYQGCNVFKTFFIFLQNFIQGKFGLVFDIKTSGSWKFKNSGYNYIKIKAFKMLFFCELGISVKLFNLQSEHFIETNGNGTKLHLGKR